MPSFPILSILSDSILSYPILCYPYLSWVDRIAARARLDSQAKQETDGATDGNDRLDMQKMAKKRIQTGKRPMEPLSEDHRTSTDFDTQASKETGKGPMEPLMEVTGTCKKNKHAIWQAPDGHSQRPTARAPNLTRQRASKQARSRWSHRLR